jgi:hypothetical protein
MSRMEVDLPAPFDLEGQIVYGALVAVTVVQCLGRDHGADARKADRAGASTFRQAGTLTFVRGHDNHPDLYREPVRNRRADLT